MIKYFVSLITDGVCRAGEPIFPWRYMAWRADKQMWIPAHQRLYTTTWADLDGAKETAEMLRKKYPEFAGNIMVDSFNSYE